MDDDELGREETKQRRALGKAFTLALKKHAKGTGWRISRGILFRDLDGWFVSAPAAVWTARRRTQIELRCKPIDLDPLFWEIVEADSNADLPLSFRHLGAWTCSTPAITAQDLDERSGDPRAMAAEALIWLDTQIGQFQSWTRRSFLLRLQQHPRAEAYCATVVTAMLLLGEYVAAELICKDAIARGDACGFSIQRESGQSQSFAELALLWLKRRRGSLH